MHDGISLQIATKTRNQNSYSVVCLYRYYANYRDGTSVPSYRKSANVMTSQSCGKVTHSECAPAAEDVMVTSQRNGRVRRDMASSSDRQYFVLEEDAASFMGNC